MALNFRGPWRTGIALSVPLAIALAACSSGPKKTTPELSRLEGKKVALVEVDAEATARQVIEVALVNQLVKRGTFILLSQQEVQKARTAPEQDATDWKGIARRAGADVALRAKVLEFEAIEQEGYDSVEEEDSELAAERGEEDSKTQRIFKVKSLEGKVRVQLEFAHLHQDQPPTATETRTGLAEATDKTVVEGKDKAVHLPPKMRFLEVLANTAFKDFFDKYE